MLRNDLAFVALHPGRAQSGAYLEEIPSLRDRLHHHMVPRRRSDSSRGDAPL